MDDKEKQYRVERSWRHDYETPPPPSSGGGEGQPQQGTGQSSPQEGQPQGQGTSQPSPEQSQEGRGDQPKEGEGKQEGQKKESKSSQKKKKGKGSGKSKAVQFNLSEIRAEAASQKSGEANKITPPTYLQDAPRRTGTESNNQAVGRAFSITDMPVSERQLAFMFSLIIGKVAEDLEGAPKPGDDFWDMDALAQRHITKKSLAECRISRERERVIICLDSSPSCASMARLYQRLARAALYRDDVEIYDTPNGYVQRKFQLHGNPIDMPFRNLFPDAGNVPLDDCPWRGRTIIFFGDFDGLPYVARTSQKNKVYYMSCQEWNADYQRYFSASGQDKHISGATGQLGYVRNQGFRGVYYPNITQASDLIEVARRIRSVAG